MLVSWNWLKEYVELPASHEAVSEALMMAGLNHESTEAVGKDFCIDLEITSNRPDCLGHIGVAREISVLFSKSLKISAPVLKEGKSPASESISVRIDAPELCSRYTARVIRGVKIASSPAWLVDRLKTIGVASVNNVVDITNYVMMECGQPLHAFDLKHIRGKQIIVRRAQQGEKFTAINHQEYVLDQDSVVIADGERAVALGGVMGGVDSEVSPSTVDLLIEAADFSQLSIRHTARKLKLQSPSSYRFERGMDLEGIDWASRRCCELILQLAGGELASGVVDAGKPPPQRPTVRLHYAQVARVLGIDVPYERIAKIVEAIGCKKLRETPVEIEVEIPSHRRDLTREIDLIEEVARIHGYDKIPEDRAVPMTASFRSDFDRVLGKTRHVLTASGFDEAMTASVVPAEWSASFSPWTDRDPYICSTPMLRGADRVRRSIIPSLLEARRVNESVSNPVVELFETAKVYLPEPTGLPKEQWTLALASGGDFYHVKGAVQSLVAELNPTAKLEEKAVSLPLLAAGKTIELSLDGQRLGFVGVVSDAGRKEFKLRQPATIAEVSLDLLATHALLARKAAPLSDFPSVSRDINLIVDEAIRWADLERTVVAAAGGDLEQVAYVDTYRDYNKDGQGKKRILLSMTFRSRERTLTSEEVDRFRDQAVSACKEKCGAALVA